MESPFQVSVGSLATLSAEDSEALVGHMIHAEADSAGIHLDQIYDGGRVSSPDGGVDFEVRGAPQESAGGLIKPGHTLYQVKSGRFSPTGGVRETLFKADGMIRESIRRCLEGGGTLVVILTAWGGSNTAGSDLEGRFADAMRGAQVQCRGSVKVWTPARVVGLLNRYPHLALSVNPLCPEGLHTYGEWSGLHDMSYPFKAGDREDDFVRRLRAHLLGDKPVHIRVTGEPGAGKTRMVLEAVRDDRLRDKVIYADGPRSVLPLTNSINRSGTGGPANSIVVVDDCDRLEQARIWNGIKNSSKVRLVTIHSEEDESTEDTVHMGVPPLADAQLGKILSTYVGTGHDTDTWVKYCKASPRAAHIVGANLRDNPDDILRPPSTVAVWDRYIAGQNDLHGSEFEARKDVLEWLSLFKAFGHGDDYGYELDRIAALVEKNAHISGDKFMSTIRTLRRMKVLQGTSMLYITPKILHIHLWVEWWKNHTSNKAPRPGDLVGSGEGGGGSRHLLQWYLDMFRYARGSPTASKVVKEMLRPGGFLDSDDTLKSGLGADFFLTLSSVDPASSLACIGRIVDRMGGERPAGLGQVHPNIPHALSQMLPHGKVFAGAMRLLLRLAVAAGGVGAARAHEPNPSLAAYCRALDPASAGISVPYASRLAALRDAMASTSLEDRRAAVHACAAVLSMRRRSIAVPTCVGFERMPDPWAPGNRAEVVGYCADVFGLLRAAAMDSGDAKLQGEAAAAVVETMHQTVLIPELSQPVVELLGDLAAQGLAGDALLDQIARLLDAERDRIGDAAAARLSSMRDSMDGGGLSAELRRRLGRHAGRGRAAGQDEGAADSLEALADRAVRSGALAAELDWLVTGEAVDGLYFGCEVGRRDADLGMLDPILAAMRRAGPSAKALFLGGYLRTAAEKRRVDLDVLLDRMLEDPAMCAHVPAVSWMMGMTERSVERIALGVSDRRLGIESLQPLRYGHRMQGVPAEAAAGLIGLVLEKCGRDERAGATALDMFHSRFVAGRRAGGRTAAAGGGPAPDLPERLALDVLLHRGLADPADGSRPDHVTCGTWRDVAAAVARLNGRAALDLAREMIDRFGDSALLHAPGPEPPSAALAEIAVRRPREVWQMIAERIAPPFDQRALKLLAWIRDGGRSEVVGAERLAGALMPGIVEWVGEDPDGRAGRMSHYLPPIFSAIRGFVVRFGDREDVRGRLAVALLAGVYRGSLVSHYADKRKRAQELADRESDPNVLSFLRHYVESIEMQIDREAVVDGRLTAGLA